MKTLQYVFIWFLIFLNTGYAQDFPAPVTPFVSDHAKLVDAETEAGITGELRRLRQDRGTEIAVVTIESRAKYGDSTSLEAFATGLLNDRAIGNADATTASRSFYPATTGKPVSNSVPVTRRSMTTG